MVKKKKNYFTRDTELAIIKYNNTKNIAKRNKIYEESIHYPFFKLTQNIIHTFKFYNTEVDNLEDLQHEIIIFLLNKIHHYSHVNNIQTRMDKIVNKEYNEGFDIEFDKYMNNADIVVQKDIDNYINTLGVSTNCRDRLKKITPPKAYSYFGTIVKNYLIIYNNENYNKKINNYLVDDLVKYSNLDIYSPNFIESSRMGEGISNVSKEDEIFEYNNPTLKDYKYEDKLSLFVDEYINYVTENIYVIFPKEYDSQIADSILEIFRKRDNLEIFNKKALYIYIREMVDVKTPKITKIAKKLYVIYKEHYLFYLDHGYSKFP